MVGLPLAEDCLLREKSFGTGTSGTVLGIEFDSVSMSWKLPAAKAASIVGVIDAFLAARTCCLKDVQKLHGKLSDFSQMCKFMKKVIGSNLQNCWAVSKIVNSPAVWSPGFSWRICTFGKSVCWPQKTAYPSVFPR